MPIDFPKDFHYNRISLLDANGITHDIKLIVAEMNIFEDIFTSTISGSIVINDTENRVSNWPIFGHEELFLDFETPDFENVKLTLRVYKVEARHLQKERLQQYIISFTSPENIQDKKVLVSKSYKGRLISDIASDIQTNFLGSKFANLETTKYLHHYIIPNLRPFSTMWWLATRANPSSFNGANYVYFQNKDGFNFVSLESLFSKPEVIEYFYQPANVREDGLLSHKRNIKDDMVSINEYNFLEQNDALSNLNDGMYGNKLVTYNQGRKKIETNLFDYDATFGSFQHVDANKLHSTFIPDLTSPDSRLRFYPSGTGFEDFPNSVETWERQRLSQMIQAEAIRMRVIVPGDSRRKVGEVVKINIPSPESLIDKSGEELDKYYSGRYLISALRHKIDQGSYVLVMELIKDSVVKAYP